MKQNEKAYTEEQAELARKIANTNNYYDAL